MSDTQSVNKKVGRGMGLMLIGTGITHFLFPQQFLVRKLTHVNVSTHTTRIHFRSRVAVAQRIEHQPNELGGRRFKSYQPYAPIVVLESLTRTTFDFCSHQNYFV